MARIDKQIVINAPPDAVWKVVGDIANIAAWLPALSASGETAEGRWCDLADGSGRLQETVLSCDDVGRRYEYTITAGLPATSHKAFMEVAAEGDGSLVTWVTEIEPDALGSALEPAFDAGLQSLKEQLER